MKANLRKHLRAQRRVCRAADHALRSNLAATGHHRAARLQSRQARRALPALRPRDGHRGADRRRATAAACAFSCPSSTSRRHARLRFYPLVGKTRRGVFGIAVPHGAARRQPSPPRWFDLIVIPLVGVDGEGRRLGMGGGFYDRALAFRRRRRHWRGPHLVGLAFDCQRTDRYAVRRTAWDVALDSLATESRTHALHHVRLLIE